jgi:hypothetical protein
LRLAAIDLPGREVLWTMRTKSLSCVICGRCGYEILNLRVFKQG